MRSKRYGITPTFNNIFWVEDQLHPYPRSLWYCTDKDNAENSVKYLNQMQDCINDLLRQNVDIKEALLTAYRNERTELGRMVLRQLLENLELL